MIRPISKVNPQRDNLFYPKYGAFGYEEPVGRRHLSTKTSAIHKLIFNQPSNQTITPNPYNPARYDFKRQPLDSSRSYSITSKGEGELSSPNYTPSQRTYQQNSIQNFSQVLEKSRMNQYYDRNYRRRDELDKILNPYKSTRQQLLAKNPESLSPNQKIGNIKAFDSHRKQNPSFLNSLL